MAALAAALLSCFAACDRKQDSPAGATQPAATAPAASTSNPQPAPAADAMETMEVAKAVMVTVELDFGKKVPSIAEALNEIERKYIPDDGRGRTFAILDARGEPTLDGKLRMSMHVSSEKPGLASLVFKRTGAVLWSARIKPASVPPAPKNLNIYFADEKGASYILDGTGNPASILDVKVRDKGVPLRDFWPDGSEREFTFVYSACGCPVKAMVKRVGEKTARTKELPVMFPDDPPAMQTISKLMRWQ